MSTLDRCPKYIYMLAGFKDSADQFLDANIQLAIAAGRVVSGCLSSWCCGLGCAGVGWACLRSHPEANGIPVHRMEW